MIQAGEADSGVAGGIESMTNGPDRLPGARAGYRIGDQKVVDAMMHDGLFCAFDMCAMGAGTEKYAASAGLERQPQDDFSATSHQRAANAMKNGDRKSVVEGKCVSVSVDTGGRRISKKKQ